MRSRTLRVLAGFALAFQLAATAATAAAPNVVIIVADDLGYGDVGFHGCLDVPTPRLDALANSGVRCTNGYVSGPYCSPTRAGLLTGRYQTRFGHEFNPGGADAGLPLSEKTIADRFKEAGYVTGLVGKWHLGASAKFHPQERGFSEFFGFLGGAHAYFPEKGILRGTTPVDEKEYLTDAFAREAAAFVDKHADKPFLLYFAFNAVHTPMHATDERKSRFAKIEDPHRRTYAAMLAALDEGVGRLMDRLKAHKLVENTLIVFISDNGGPTMQGTTVNGSSNKPLRGSKRTTLEGGVRVPFVVSWPTKLPQGVVYDHPVIQLDVLPTALAAIGGETKPEWKLDGVNLLPFLQGEIKSPPHETLYWRFGQQMAIRRGDWKLVAYDPAVEGGAQAKKGGVLGPKLYNLAADLGESKDLATEQPEKVKELKTAWQAWNSGLAAPLWGAGKKGGD